MPLTWIQLHPQADPEMLGFLPGFLDDDDPDPAAKQIDKNYRHGGGWQPFGGFRLDPDYRAIRYAGDPPMRALFGTMLRDERIIFYEAQWLAIIQPGGAFEISRVD